jgi:hypothetical protein
VRAQFEAASGLVGGFDKQVSENPGLVNRVGQWLQSPAIQRLGIDHAVLKSQILNLAYLTAQANEPGGRLNEADVDRAAQMVAASSQDPGTMIAVLSQAHARLGTNYSIRDQHTRAMLGQNGATIPAWNLPPLPARGAPGAVAPPQAAPATAPAAGGGTGGWSSITVVQ